MIRDELKRQWDLLAAHPGTPQFGRFRKSFLKRMWNAGEFMKTLKQHFTLHYLSPLAKAGYIEMVDSVNKSSCRCAYRLTRKGREVAKWH